MTAIHKTYLHAFTVMVTTHLPDTRRQALRVMEGTLPFLLAQSRKEDLLERRAKRGGANRGPADKPLSRLMQDVFGED